MGRFIWSAILEVVTTDTKGEGEEKREEMREEERKAGKKSNMMEVIGVEGLLSKPRM